GGLEERHDDTDFDHPHGKIMGGDLDQAESKQNAEYGNIQAQSPGQVAEDSYPYGLEKRLAHIADIALDIFYDIGNNAVARGRRVEFKIRIGGAGPRLHLLGKYLRFRWRRQ